MGGERGWRWKTWPRRTLWPTRDGWWCLAAATGLGFAAMNTGNNLLYLLDSMLLGVIIVSGVLSEQCMRGLHFVAILPDEVYAGRLSVFGLRVINRKRWRASYSVVVEVLDGQADAPRAFVPRLEPGAGELLTWDRVVARRGRHPFPRLRVSTRFPFGLFVKGGQIRLDADVVVFPAVRVLTRDVRREIGGAGVAARQRGRGVDLYNLREYRGGDDPRLIHWRTSARTGTLVVRELEADVAIDARIVLDGAGTNAERLEAGIADAASIASHLCRAGAGVELDGPGLHVSLRRGREHRRTLLTALALYDPAHGDPQASVSAARSRAGLREIHVSIG